MQLDAELIKLIGYFEQRTSARVKDAFYDKNEKLTFVVEPGELGKALGKQAKNLRDLEKRLNKRVRIAEFSADKLQFIQNLVAPLKVVEIEELYDGVIAMRGPDEKTNGLLIGKGGRNLRNLEWMVGRFGHEVPEIKVV